MEYDALYFQFPRALSEDEENRLISAFQAISNSTKERFSNANKQLSPFTNFSKEAALVKERFSQTDQYFFKLIRLYKKSDCIYAFLIAKGAFDGLAPQIPILKQEGQFRKKLFTRLKDFILKNPARDIGFKESQIQISEGIEVENENSTPTSSTP